MQFSEGAQSLAVTAPVASFDPASPFACWYMLALLTWPKSKRQQSYALATYAAHLMAVIREDGPTFAAGEFSRHVSQVAEQVGVSEEELLSMPEARTVAEAMASDVAALRETTERELFDPAGGFQAVADAPGAPRLRQEGISALYGGVENVGLALYLVARMQQCMPANAPASLNRAFSIIEATAEIRGRPKISDRTLKEHWKEWRGIAPLSAALQAWEMQRPSGNQANYARSQALMTKQGISSLLMWAKWFRWFATTFTPHKGQGVLIPEREAVIYNVALSEEMPPLPPLRQFEMEAAMRYHAPTLKSGY